MIDFLGALAVALGVATVVTAWVWPRTAIVSQLSKRLGDVALVVLPSFGATLFAFAARPVTTLAVLAVLALALAVACGWRLHAAPLPDTEATGRVSFEGTAHALGEPMHVPSVAKLPCVAWLVRQGDRRWSSDARFEVRSGERRVLVEPSATTSLDRPWTPAHFTLRAIAAELGAAQDKLLRVWMVNEGDPVIVVGETTLEDDEARPGYREPARVHRFSNAVWIARGPRAAAMRPVHVRLAIAIALGAAAGALAILR